MRTPIHPGDVLREELAERSISITELSRKLRVPANRISQLVNRKRAMTADTALRIGKYLGTGPELWMNLQSMYDLDLARREHQKEFDVIPCAEEEVRACA